jgi:hypothetical protein
MAIEVFMKVARAPRHILTQSSGIIRMNLRRNCYKGEIPERELSPRESCATLTASRVVHIAALNRFKLARGDRR